MPNLFITLLTSLSLLLGQGITPVSAALPVYTAEESAWRDKGVELAGNVTQAVLTATGADAQDIAIGTTNGTIAAENNALFLIPVAVVALEVIDKGLIAYDTYKLAEAANNCNNGDRAACSVATEMSQDLAIAAGIEATVGNLVPGSQAVAKLVNKLGKSDNAPNVVNNTAATNPTTKGNTTGDSPGRGTPNTEQPNQHNIKEDGDKRVAGSGGSTPVGRRTGFDNTGPDGIQTDGSGRQTLQWSNGDTQPNINQPSTINDRDYSGHALDQMQNRGVTPSVIENTIITGKRVPGKVPGTFEYIDNINGVNVIVNSSGRVVTVK